jgi:signal transduction histidine kinase
LKLRARLALTVLATAVPLLAAIGWLRADLVRRDQERALSEFAMARMESGGRERCESDPAYFSISVPPRGAPPRAAPPDDDGPGAPPAPPPPERRLPPAPSIPPDRGGDLDEPTRPPPVPLTRLWAYAADFTSRNRGAPPIEGAMRAKLAAGADEAGLPYEPNGLHGRQLAVRTPWPDGPCAFVLVRRIEPAPPGSQAFPLWAAAGLLVVVLAVVLLAAGPVVRRIAQLTSEVRRAAADRYATPVAVDGGGEIAELARAFNDAGAEVRRHLDDAARREETLRAFVANTTHDVMTPLTVLQGHLAALRQRAPQSSADAETVRAAIEEAHYLGALVHNLGAAAKLDAGEQQVHLAPVSLNDLVQRIVERHWALASPRAIEIEFAVPEKPVWIDADVTLLEQAVANVVGNAVRYNRPGGHVAVVLGEANGSEFTLRVIDDGPGVPDADLARLTERAFRGDDARRRSPEGTGLGLDIARRVAELHRLRLSFRRSQHGGLEVEFRGVSGITPV